MIEIGGGSAFTEARQQKKLTLVRRANPGIRALNASFDHFVDYDGKPTSTEISLLERLLKYGPRPTSERRARHGRVRPRLLVVPRLGTISPWSSKATDIAHSCGLTQGAGASSAASSTSSSARSHDEAALTRARCTTA